MSDQPFLPGFKLTNTQSKNHHLSQHFEVLNGFSVPKLNLQALPDIKYQSFYDCNRQFQSYDVENDFIKFSPFERYRKRVSQPKPFRPHFVEHDRKCLSFQGYFKQEISPDDHEKRLFRKINMIYYLEDDTMTIFEPPVANSGYPQGRLVRRGRIPKSAKSEEKWHWKNLNVGIDVEIYGIVYHLSSCDAFSREYLLSQGIEVSPNEEIPENILRKNDANRRYSVYYGLQENVPSRDKLYNFLQFDRKVLRFYAIWENAENELAEAKYYKIYYYLIDDTVEVRQLMKRHVYNNTFNRFLSRTRLPKNRHSSAQINTSISQSTDDLEFYAPKDFIVGESIFIVGRKFLLYDCDEFTRRYYEECLKIQQPAAVNIVEKRAELVTKEIPPHTGIGQPEDTLQSCLSIVPKPPKKDVIHYVENANKTLRYSAKLDSVNESDKDREFIIQFSLADGKMSIYETKTPNSGFSSGYFLKSALVPKTSTSMTDTPQYYTPADFIIGDKVDIFGRKFIITGADLAVYHYMREKSHKFSEEVTASVEKYLQREGLLDSDTKQEEIEPQIANNTTAIVPYA